MQTTIKQQNKRLEPSGTKYGLMLVGVNPSRHSGFSMIWYDKFGKFLWSILIDVGINPMDVWVTNLYKYSTKNNRRLNRKEIEDGLIELSAEIGYVNPTIIVTFGKQVSDAFRTDIGVLKNWKAWRVFGAYHPSYALRHKKSKVALINQLKLAKKYHESIKKRMG